MTGLPYWSVPAIQIWICTRDLNYVHRRLTGDAERNEESVYDVLAKFQFDPVLDGTEDKRSLIVSTKQADAELLSKLQKGDIKAKGIRCDPRNGDLFSGPRQEISAEEWGLLQLGLSPRLIAGKVAAYRVRDDLPSWRYIACPAAVVHALWPAEASSSGERVWPSEDIEPPPSKIGRPDTVKRPVTQVWDRRREEGLPFVSVSEEYRAIGGELNLPDKSAKNAKAVISTLARTLKP